MLTESSPIRVLLVDDDENDYLLTARWLSRIRTEEFQLDWAATYAKALDTIREAAHDVYLFDYRLGDGNGLDLLREALASGCTAPIIVLTGTGDHEVDVQAPLLERALRYALYRARAQKRLASMTAELEKSRDDLLTVLDQIRVGSAIVDQKHDIAFLSQDAARILERQAGEAQGCAWNEVLPLDKGQTAEVRRMMELPEGSRQKLALSFERPSGQRCFVDLEIKDDPRQRERKILLFYDVTDVSELRRLLDEKAQFHHMVGRSAPMQSVFRRIRDVAGVDVTVLIQGETGAGKELVARAMHARSQRSKGPFVAVNCAGLTESVLSSQLFGHRRGSFTGAVEDHEGFFETANKGTLFLDEIGDISTSVQASLLRALEQREIVRLGESRPRKIDVRILAATHRNLDEEAESGRFRRDLLYRIRVVRLHVPALRDRREDIPLLTAAFLAECRATTGKKVYDVSAEAMAALAAYPWPGNVRELRNATEYAMLQATRAVLQVDDLPPEVLEEQAPGSFDGDERAQLMAALRQAGGNRTRAARLLGVSRATFYRRLTALGSGS
jgi:DNA-binding NtrC family response regulator